MKVGDLIRWKHADPGAGDEEDIGIVVNVWGKGFIDAIFADGEHCVAIEDYEVISAAE